MSSSLSSRAMVAGVAAVSLGLAAVGVGGEPGAAAAAARPRDVVVPPPAGGGVFAPVVVLGPPVVPPGGDERALLQAERVSRGAARPARVVAPEAAALVGVVARRPVGRHRATARPAAATRHVVAGRHRVAARPRRTAAVLVRGGLGAAVAFAYAQLGDRYVHGASGPGAWDCSGLTRAAYARAGIRLPHSAAGQAAMARSIPRSVARPGDLVVGAGHVGIYVGRGLIIDAGNPRVGVSLRRMWAGLHIERL